MKIALIVPNFYPYKGGGVERVVYNTYKLLAEKYGIFVDIYSCNPFKVGIFSLNEKIKIFNYRTYKSFPFPKIIFDLLKKIKSKEYNIIHIYNIHNPLSIISLFFPKCNMIISPYFHGKGHDILSKILWRLLYKKIAEKILSKQIGIIVNSNFQQNTIMKYFNLKNKKFWLVYDGVEINKLVNNQVWNNKKDKLILSVSRLEKYKNIHLIIKAFQFLPNNYKLIIVGYGSKAYEIKLLKEIIKLNLNNRVYMLGFQPDKIIWELYKNSDVFINLSEIESFGMTCVEALAAGTPVIINNDKGGLLEVSTIFKDNVYIFDINSQDLKQLADLIIYVSNTKPININNDILRQFNWEQISEKIYNIYLSVIKNNENIEV